MVIEELILQSNDQVVVRVTREVLRLFKVRIVAEERARHEAAREKTSFEAPKPEYRSMCISHDVSEGGRVISKIVLKSLDGNEERYVREGCARPDERLGAGIHRLMKHNLYRIFCEELGKKTAPWGIMYGVRPTKIVHRLIDMGLGHDEIIERLKSDYLVSSERASRITDIAFLQRPFLAQSDERTISIYAGIPFCLSRCLYCSFPANVIPGRGKLEKFFRIWKRDLDAVVAAVRKYHFRVQNIYIGGGTPTSLPDDLFIRMLELIHDAFYSDSVVEFTVEAGRPDSMSQAKIDAMMRMNVTRVSVNPQTMQERTLARIGRSHTPGQIVDMFHALRKAGIPHINMDLIVGLPGETDADIADTMEKILPLGPDDVTLHALALKKGSRLKMHLADYELPDDAMAQRMFDTAMKYVESFGFHPYYLYRQGYMAGSLENVGCCKTGAEGMYNIQIMEEHQTVLGIGAAASSKIVNFRTGRLKSSFNAKDLTTYLADVDTYIAKRDALLEEAYGGEKQL